MRIFTTLEEAFAEVRRDLSKAPVVVSSRVQQLKVKKKARERFGYTAMIQKMPSSLEEFKDMHTRLFPDMDADTRQDYFLWVRAELTARLDPNTAISSRYQYHPAELLHQILSKLGEGNHWSYTYYERMVGMIPTIIGALAQTQDTRRAYWPIFNQNDAFRSSAQTRIPCSLGYDFIIRRVNEKPTLLCFYLMRSSDFDTFWLSDLFFAAMIQKRIHEILMFDMKLGKIELGGLGYFSVSLHSFFEEGDETY